MQDFQHPQYIPNNENYQLTRKGNGSLENLQTANKSDELVPDKADTSGQHQIEQGETYEKQTRGSFSTKKSSKKGVSVTTKNLLSSLNSSSQQVPNSATIDNQEKIKKLFEEFKRISSKKYIRRPGTASKLEKILVEILKLNS